mmetsp:Transcript_13086/g.21382  ORF Transcript_13086/g.21382 Transcript_13086/m.21382 type:complete len:89 (+) Transcript_13086:491-757(+)
MGMPNVRFRQLATDSLQRGYHGESIHLCSTAIKTEKKLQQMEEWKTPRFVNFNTCETLAYPTLVSTSIYNQQALENHFGLNCNIWVLH